MFKRVNHFFPTLKLQRVTIRISYIFQLLS